MADGSAPKFIRFTPRLWKSWQSDRLPDKATAVLREGIDQMREKLAAKELPTLDDIKGFYARGDEHYKRCKSCGALTGEIKKITLREARKAGYDAGWRERSYAIQGLTSAESGKRPPYVVPKLNLEWQKGYDKGYAECF
jgi:hypothetical protein